MSVGVPSTPARAFAVALAVLAALAVGHYGWQRATWLSLANHDIAWFLHAGAVWLDGGVIGIDIVDTNPPLAIWLAGLEVGLARWLGLSPLVVHAGVTSALVLGSALLTGAGLLRSRLSEIAVFVFLPLVIVASAVVTQYEFGQRDHWIALLLMPYPAWAFAGGSRGRGARAPRLAAGACAGLAVCLKPHYAGAVAAVELLRWLGTRSVRSWVRRELVTGAGVVLLYLAALLWLAPSYLGDLRATFAVYHAYDAPVPAWSRHTAWLLAALAAGAAAWAVRREHKTPLALALVAATGWIAVMIQHKNFAYHYIPSDLFAFATLALAFGIAAASTLGPRATARRLLLLPALVLVSVFGVESGVSVFALQSGLVGPETARWREQQRAFIDHHAAGEAVLIFSTSATAIFPTIDFTRARSVSPYSCLWPIPGNYDPAARRARPFRYRSWEEMTAVERRLVSHIVDVLARERPRLLGFDMAPFKQGFRRTGFQFQSYFAVHPEFTGLLEDYEPLAVVGGFKYYRRRDR